MVGDGENDIDMLKYVNIGIAMGNAIDEVKAIADCVIGDNDHDGIAVYLQNNICRKGLKNEECKYI